MEETMLVSKWKFEGNNGMDRTNTVHKMNIRVVLQMLMDNINKHENRAAIPLGHGDPSVFESFRSCNAAEDAIADALRSAKYNCYAPSIGILPARRCSGFLLIYYILFSSKGYSKNRSFLFLAPTHYVAGLNYLLLLSFPCSLLFSSCFFFFKSK